MLLLKLPGSVAMTLKILVKWIGERRGNGHIQEQCARLGRSKEGEAELKELKVIRSFVLRVNRCQLLGSFTCDGERRMREISILLPQNRREGYKNIEIIAMFMAASFAP